MYVSCVLKVDPSGIFRPSCKDGPNLGIVSPGDVERYVSALYAKGDTMYGYSLSLPYEYNTGANVCIVFNSNVASLFIYEIEFGIVR